MKVTRAALGLDNDHVFDIIKRSEFNSDDEFLTACAEFELQRNRPELQQVKRRLAREWAEVDEDAVREQQRKQYDEIRAAVKLDYLDKRQIDGEARRLAQSDLALNKISASGLSDAITQYAERLTAQRLDQKAAAQQMNSLLRREG